MVAMIWTSLSMSISAFLLLLIFIWAADAWPANPSATDCSIDSITSTHPPRTLPKRDDTSNYLRDQFINPQGIIAVLLLIGGDVVQKAIAQGTGGRHDIFTPVVFSFGWVSYAFNSVAGAIGDGTFLPPPDCPATVINVTSGDRRQNQSWVLGRLLRDLELKVEEETTETERDSGLLVTVYKAEPSKSRHHGTFKPKRRWLWYWFAVGVLIQLAVAAAPVYAPWRDDERPPRRDWSILLVTVAGNLLASCSSFIPSIRQEKYQGNKHSKHTYVITRGNGHKHVFIIMPNTMIKKMSCLPSLDHLATAKDQAYFTDRLLSIIPAILWIVLLLIVGGLVEHTWFLLGVGVLGMVHNILLSGWRLEPETHGIPIKRLRRIERPGEESEDDYSALGRKKLDGQKPKVMNVLKEVERKFPGVGHALLPIFFPGGYHENWSAADISEKTIKRRLQKQQLDWYTREQLPENHPSRSHQTMPTPDEATIEAANRVLEAADWVNKFQDKASTVAGAKDAAMEIIENAPKIDTTQNGDQANAPDATVVATFIQQLQALGITVGRMSATSDYDKAIQAIFNAHLQAAASKVNSSREAAEFLLQIRPVREDDGDIPPT
ncbi:hypothetical protein F4806DRAFT_481503 [Annulohypoxylon nitens]|nr:hypothetical protein F4806DRAFT_481503 [Annulohypoxylon nitens]